MASREVTGRRGYYFALPRLCARISGRDPNRGEDHPLEAYGGGVAVFLVSYAALLAQLSAGAVAAIGLVFVTWIAWVVVFYVNSLVARALRSAGMFATVENAHAQSVFVALETTACAIALTIHRDWAIIGWAWLLIVTANTAAAVVLRLTSKRDA